MSYSTKLNTCDVEDIIRLNRREKLARMDELNLILSQTIESVNAEMSVLREHLNDAPLLNKEPKGLCYRQMELLNMMIRKYNVHHIKLMTKEQILEAVDFNVTGTEFDKLVELEYLREAAQGNRVTYYLNRERL